MTNIESRASRLARRLALSQASRRRSAFSLSDTSEKALETAGRAVFVPAGGLATWRAELPN